METKEKINKGIDELDNKFEKLINEKRLNINSIENIALESVNNLKNIINNHIENLISKKDETELINKKNKNGKIKDFN